MKIPKGSPKLAYLKKKPVVVPASIAVMIKTKTGKKICIRPKI
jgi:hypothetical protein